MVPSGTLGPGGRVVLKTGKVGCPQDEKVVWCPVATLGPGSACRPQDGRVGWGQEGRSNLPSQGNTSTGPRRFVHLTEYQCDLGFAIELNDGGFLHLVVQIITLTSTLTHTREDRVTTVGFGDVVLHIVSCRTLTYFDAPTISS